MLVIPELHIYITHFFLASGITAMVYSSPESLYNNSRTNPGQYDKKSDAKGTTVFIIMDELLNRSCRSITLNKLDHYRLGNPLHTYIITFVLWIQEAFKLDEKSVWLWWHNFVEGSAILSK